MQPPLTRYVQRGGISIAAEELRQRVGELNIELRAGIHTGECEAISQDLGGLAGHIGARVSGLAGPGEIVVSSTVKELVVGSGMQFTDRGEQELKACRDSGVCTSWATSEHRWNDSTRRHGRCARRTE